MNPEPPTNGAPAPLEIVPSHAYEEVLRAIKDKRWTWLREHRLLTQIVGRMIAGWQPHRLALYVQDRVAHSDPLGVDNVAPHVLAARFQRLRKRLPKTLFLPRAYLDDLIIGADAEIEVLAELNALITYQKLRIDLLRTREADMGMPIEQQRKEIQTLLDLLMRARDTQIALGVTPGMLAPTIHVDGGGERHEDSGIETRLERYLREHPEDLAGVVKQLEESLPIQGDWHEAIDSDPAADVPDADGQDVRGLPDHSGGGPDLRPPDQGGGPEG